MTQKVVITGMGTINALGKSVSETWRNLVEGVSGAGPITLFDASDFLVRFACEVKDYDPTDFLTHREARRQDRFEQFAVIAADEAIKQSGIEVNEGNADRIGIVISATIGGLQTIQDSMDVLREKGGQRISPQVIPMLMPNGAAGLVGIRYGIKGPSMSVASACASGADGLGTAWMMIRAGMVDVMIAGASEATITELGIAAFDKAGAMSRRGDDYALTPQPFDLNRDGLVMGEGSAILVLESEKHAKDRGADIIAEFIGYHATADAYNIVKPLETGAGGAAAMTQALRVSEINPQDVGYINAHGTGTKFNDIAETLAIKTTFGDHANNVAISSSKSMTGHMIGATGALEALVCVKTILEGIITPTINYVTPDPECDLDYVPNEARQQKTRVAMSNAFGFGGHNAVVVMSVY